jgi:hypothetical protein
LIRSCTQHCCYFHVMWWRSCKTCRMPLSKRGRRWHPCFIHIAVVSKHFLRFILGLFWIELFWTSSIYLAILVIVKHTHTHTHTHTHKSCFMVRRIHDPLMHENFAKSFMCMLNDKYQASQILIKGIFLSTPINYIYLKHNNKVMSIISVVLSLNLVFILCF